MAQHGEDGVGGSGEIVDEGGEVSTTLQKVIGRIRDSKFWGKLYWGLGSGLDEVCL